MRRPEQIHRRKALLASLSALGSVSIGFSNTAQANSLPRLGVVADASVPGGPDAALAIVRHLGLSTCQLAVGMAASSLAEPIRRASAKYGIEITALMTLGSGRMVWNLREGPPNDRFGSARHTQIPHRRFEARVRTGEGL